MAELKTIITLRQGTTAEWAESTVRLVEGEMGLEYLADGTVKIKAGILGEDGQGKLWADLPYIGSDVKAANVFQVELAEGDVDDIAAIEAQVALENAEKQDGDVAIVKALIAEGKYSYTSYVYEAALDVEGNEACGWTAMDGNYSASNVFLKNNITLAGSFETVGNYTKGDTINAGTSLESILSSMLQQELPPVKSIPTASISASGSSGEVGSSYTLPTATLKIDSVGSYTYGPATGITFAIDNVSLTQGSNTVKNTSVMAANSTLKLQATDSETLFTDTKKTYTFSATATHTEGAVPVTNLGNAYPDEQIAAGSITIADKSVDFTGYRYSFAGGTTAAAIDSTVARSMAAKKSSKATSSAPLEFTAAAGATKVFFTYPATWTGTPYFEMFGLAWAENSDFAAKDNIKVADARGTVDGELQGAIDYKLYAWELDTPLQAESTKFRVWFK